MLLKYWSPTEAPVGGLVATCTVDPLPPPPLDANVRVFVDVSAVIVNPVPVVTSLISSLVELLPDKRIIGTPALALAKRS